MKSRERNNARIRREETIMEIARRHERVRTCEICSVLRVSEPTVRACLHRLEAQGKLRCIRGGAVLPGQPYCQPRSSAEMVDDACAKELRRIAGDIRSDETIFLSDGIKPRLLLKYIPENTSCNILTNSIPTALEADADACFNVILLGGSTGRSREYTCGGDGVEQLNGYCIDRAFFEVDSITSQSDLMLNNYLQLELLRAVLHSAKQRIAFVSGADNGAFVRLCSAEDMEQIIMA